MWDSSKLDELLTLVLYSRTSNFNKMKCYDTE